MFSPLVQVLLKAVEEVGGIYLVTADHGNAEEMVKHDKNGNPVLLKDGQPQKLTAHTCAPVSTVCSLTSPCRFGATPLDFHLVPLAFGSSFFAQK